MSLGVGRSFAALDQPVIPWLWVLAVLFFGVGDVATTVVGLSIPGISEGNPVVRPAVAEYGLVAIVSLKLVSFSVALLVWTVSPDPYSLGVPLGLVALGVLLTAWNLFVVTSILVV